jgi:hypothetical protein
VTPGGGLPGPCDREGCSWKRVGWVLYMTHTHTHLWMAEGLMATPSATEQPWLCPPAGAVSDPHPKLQEEKVAFAYRQILTCMHLSVHAYMHPSIPLCICKPILSCNYSPIHSSIYSCIYSKMKMGQTLGIQQQTPQRSSLHSWSSHSEWSRQTVHKDILSGGPT